MDIAQKIEQPLIMNVSSNIWRNLVQHVSGEIELIISIPSLDMSQTIYWTVHSKKVQKARNVILAISDGTSTAMISAARMIAKRSSMRSGKFKVPIRSK